MMEKTQMRTSNPASAVKNTANAPPTTPSTMKILQEEQKQKQGPPILWKVPNQNENPFLVTSASLENQGNVVSATATAATTTKAVEVQPPRESAQVILEAPVTVVQNPFDVFIDEQHQQQPRNDTTTNINREKDTTKTEGTTAVNNVKNDDIKNLVDSNNIISNNNNYKKDETREEEADEEDDISSSSSSCSDSYEEHNDDNDDQKVLVPKGDSYVKNNMSKQTKHDSSRRSSKRSGALSRRSIRKVFQNKFKSKSKIHTDDDNHCSKGAKDIVEEQDKQIEEYLNNNDDAMNKNKKEQSDSMTRTGVETIALGSDTKKDFEKHITFTTTGVDYKATDVSPPLTPVRAHGMTKASAILKREALSSPTCVKAKDLFYHSHNSDIPDSSLVATTTPTKNQNQHGFIDTLPPMLLTPLSLVERNVSNPYESQHITHHLMRCSELEPSGHQLKLPKCDDILFHARVCQIMDNYQTIMERNHNNNNDPTSDCTTSNFSLSNLVGRSRLELEAMYTRITLTDDATTPSATIAITQMEGASTPGAIASDEISLPHPSLLKSILDCAIDLTVEGYFENDTDGVEVAIFSSQHHRQFIVCYRGSSEKQYKPLSSDDDSVSSSSMTALYPSDHKIPIYGPFRDAYFDKENLEGRVFTLLEKLTEDSPFCDIVYTGHSFGGALATIGSVRFAEQHPIGTTGVYCHVFGSPRISANNEFRQLSHSFSNLNIIRVENGSDPYVNCPSDHHQGGKSNSSLSWTHVGHTIRLLDHNSSNNATTELINETPSSRFVKAFKFDEQRNEDNSEQEQPKTPILRRKVLPRSTSSKGSSVLSNLTITSKTKKNKMKHDHELYSYIKSIEFFTHGGLPWVNHFEGEVGKGVTAIVPELKVAGALPGINQDVIIMKEEKRIVV